MIQIKYQKAFIKEFKKLPKAQKLKLIELESLFRRNPFHPQLHSKKLQGKLKNQYSFRITREYRVIFEFLEEGMVGFIAVKHRKDIYIGFTQKT